MKALYYANKKEQDAVAWLKRQRHKGGAMGYALRELAYSDEPYAQQDWSAPTWRGFGMSPIPRDRWLQWESRPYGHPSMNEMHQWAKRCLRRNFYFPDLARKIGRRSFQ